MSRIAVVGPSARMDAWALAGVLVVDTRDAAAVVPAWEHLPPDVEIVVVSPAVAEVLGSRLAERLAVVLP